jgi:hypothetical protein
MTSRQKSLTAITISPQVTHLDQVRIEYNEDGTTTERSTREWIASLTDNDGISPALCDAVNGTNFNKAYFVTPSQFYNNNHNIIGSNTNQDSTLQVTEKLGLEKIYQAFQMSL